MTVVAIAPWHSSPAHLVDQILSYNAAFDGEVFHIININKDFHDKFWNDAKNLGIDFSQFSNLHFMPNPRRTFYAGVAPVFFDGAYEAFRLGINFTHVFWHTSSDLMFKRGAAEYVKKFDIGFEKRTWVAHFDINEDFEVPEKITYKSEIVRQDFWFKNLAVDPLLLSFLKETKSNVLHKSRFEGSFFAKDIFFDLMEPLLNNRTLEQMAPSSAPYPLEEFLFVQCAMLYVDKYPHLLQAPSMVYTEPSNKSILSVEKLKELTGVEGVFGAKRFTHDLNSRERQFVRESLGM